MKKIKLTKKQIENIIQEEAIPVGLNITMGVHKQDGKENQDYYKEFGKKMDDYYKPLGDTEKENAESVMKYSYDKDSDEYHNEYEILNGQEMLRYMNDPDERFKDRAEKAIAGSPEMGNNPEWANVVTADQAGFTGPDFGKQLVARIKGREEKYQDEDKLEKYDGMGDVAIPGAGKGEQRKLAIAENKDNTENKKTMKRLNEAIEFDTKPVVGYANDHKDNTHFAIHKPTNSIVFTWDYSDYEPSELKYAKDDYFWVDVLDVVDGNIDKFKKSDFAIVTRKGLSKKGIDLNNYLRFLGQKYDKLNENKKTMKRLRFKKPFNGVENALNLIPESYRVDNKIFQMTDGNENYEVRWEGSLNEGKAVVLKSSEENLINEDMKRMKELFNFDSRNTLGTLKGKDRLNEDNQFSTIWDKTKNINEMTGGYGFTGEGNLKGNKPMIDEEDKSEEDKGPNKGYIAVYRVMGQDFTVGPLDTNDKNKVAKLLNSMIMGGYRLIDIVPADKFDGVEKYGGLMLNKESVDEEEKVEEAAKPDFLDLDKDGDKEESMKKAAKEKEEEEEEEEVNEMGLKPSDRKKKTAKAHSKKDRRAKDKKTTKKELEDMVNEAVKKK
jgi:hypothetical protein